MKQDIADQRQMYHSLDGPSWRWKLAARLADLGSRRLACIADRIVKQAVLFISLLLGDDDATLAAESFPEIAAAKSLWDNPETRQRFIILTLGDCPRDLIAERLGVTLEIVECLELLFFDVRDCRHAKDWINAHVIRAESMSGAYDVAIKYRMAFYGGPVIAQAILDARVPLDEVERIDNQKSLLYMKAIEALEIPLKDSKSALQLLKITVDYTCNMKKLELADEKFRHKCEQDIRKIELAKRRLEVAAEREKAQAEWQRGQASEREQKKQEKAKLLEIRTQLRQERFLVEERAAMERAAKSPLAKLSWTASKCSEGPLHQENTIHSIVLEKETGEDSITAELAHTAA